MTDDVYDHPPCCGPGCQGVACWDCRGTGHPHAPDVPWELGDADRPVPGRWTRLPDGGLSWVPTSTVTAMTTNQPQPETTEVAVEQPAKITTTTEVDATADTVNVDPTSDAGPAEAQPAAVVDGTEPDVAVEVHTKD